MTMELWNRVCETDPDTTKKVSQRGGFTAICAMSQIMEATKEFGPMGKDWGVRWEILDSPASLCLLRVTLWYGKGDDVGEVCHAGSASWGTADRIDQDALKKAITDGTTKCLSMLGFNADVFLGKFDDDKYIEAQRGITTPINHDQIFELEELVSSSGADRDKFIAHVGTIFECKVLSDLNLAQYNTVKHLLESKITNAKAAS